MCSSKAYFSFRLKIINRNTKEELCIAQTGKTVKKGCYIEYVAAFLIYSQDNSRNISYFLTQGLHYML